MFSFIPLWGWLDIVFTLSVLAGVCAEVEWIQKRLIPEKPNELVPVALKRARMKKGGEFLLILGLAGELACLPFGLWESSRANERAANVEATNLVLREKVVKLEAKLRDRTITDAQLEILLKCFEDKPKGEVLIGADMFDAEAIAYARRIADVLNRANFIVRNFDQSGSRKTILSMGQSGVFMLVKDVNNAPPYAPAIIDCFHDVGETVSPSSSDSLQCPSNCLVVWVGKKK